MAKDVSTMTPEQVAQRDADLKKKRGYTKVNGIFVFPKEVLEGQIRKLKLKKADFKKRIANVEKTIKEKEELLKRS